VADARRVKVIVDGRPRTALAEPRLLLSDFLRHELGLTSVHVGCEQGGCGACTILLDGRLALSCLTLAVQADGSTIDTVAGLSRDGELHPIQRAFQACHGLQCGFCTPAMLVTARVLLEQTPDPTDAEIRDHLSGNVCRCTGYAGIVASVREAARLLGEERA
jgi:carbon-monoxide dehydrogenase small subunit